jgi:hypothetical protein
LLFVLGWSVNEFLSNVRPIGEGVFCLMIYCPGLIIAIVVLLRMPFSPQSDPTHERFTKGALYGRRSCFWGGLGMVGCCLSGLLVMGSEFYVAFSGGISAGQLTCGRVSPWTVLSCPILSNPAHLDFGETRRPAIRLSCISWRKSDRFCYSGLSE